MVSGDGDVLSRIYRMRVSSLRQRPMRMPKGTPGVSSIPSSLSIFFNSESLARQSRLSSRCRRMRLTRSKTPLLRSGKENQEMM